MTKEMILEIVSNASGQSKEKIMGIERYKPYLTARHVFIFFTRKKLKCTLMEIGKFLNRDHTTIIHSVQKVQDLLDVNDYDITNLYDKVDFAYQQATKEPHRVMIEFSKDENISEIMNKLVAFIPCKITKL